MPAGPHDAWADLLRASTPALPGADPLRWAVAALDHTPVGAALDAEFAAFDERTRALVEAHGAWDSWEPDRAAALLALEPTALDPGAFALLRAGWLAPEPDGLAWSLPARALRRARVRPSPTLRSRAAAAAEAAFHRARAHGEHVPEALADALTRACAWAPDAPEVAQWARLHRRELTAEEAHPAAATWVWLHRARVAQSIGQRVEARRCRDRAAALPQSPESAALLALVDAWDAIDGSGDVDGALERLRDLARTEFERLLHLFTLAVVRSRRADPAVAETLAAGVHLAREAGIPHMEAHFLHVSAAHWRVVDPDRARRFLDAVDRLGLPPSGRLLQENLVQRGIQARVEGDLPRAIAELRACADVAARSSDKLMEARCQALLAGYLHQDGQPGPAGEALVAAQVLLAGTAHEDHLLWAEGVIRGDPRLDPRGPSLVPPRRVDRDGRWFAMGSEVVELANQPVSAALLRALAAGPASADALQEAAWPGDRSSPTSLRDRLHAAVRALRRRGLGDALVFEDGVYRLEGFTRVG